jgi:hypothetical protein
VIGENEGNVGHVSARASEGRCKKEEDRSSGRVCKGAILEGLHLRVAWWKYKDVLEGSRRFLEGVLVLRAGKIEASLLSRENKLVPEDEVVVDRTSLLRQPTTQSRPRRAGRGRQEEKGRTELGVVYSAESWSRSCFVFQFHRGLVSVP